MIQKSENNFARTVFFVSDGTGITAETLGHSVLAQFDLQFKQVRLPFTNTLLKVQEVIIKINQTFTEQQQKPIVFSTLVTKELNTVLRQSQGMHIDLFQTFVEPLEQELGVRSSPTVGRSHDITRNKEYDNRIEAINFSLTHDDGQSHRNLEQADVILVGVSRSGKTPTSLYLAMQYGIKAANYPLTPDDFARDNLPSILLNFRSKLFGLSIAPERLAEIRHERRPSSHYAKLENCRYEVRAAERLMERENIRWLSSTSKSIEEIAATVLQEVKLEKKLYG